MTSINHDFLLYYIFQLPSWERHTIIWMAFPDVGFLSWVPRIELNLNHENRCGFCKLGSPYWIKLFLNFFFFGEETFLNLNHESDGNVTSFWVGRKFPNIFFLSVLLLDPWNIPQSFLFTFPSVVVKKSSLFQLIQMNYPTCCGYFLYLIRDCRTNWIGQAHLN